MSFTQRSPIRFILFLVVLGALITYVVMKWGAYQEQAFNTDWETLPVVMPPNEDADGDQQSTTDESTVSTLSPAGETRSAVGDVRAVAENTFFADSRLERERVRSQRIELLKNIVENPNSDAEARRQAEQELIELSRRITQEAEIESLIQARGFEEVLVYLYDDASVVIVKADELTAEQAAQAADAVAKVAGIPFPGINVMARSE